jgi:hypothetical protein
MYFEPAAVIVALVLLGQVLELRARSQTSGAIRALLGLAPKTAKRLDDQGGGGGHRISFIRLWRPTFFQSVLAVGRLVEPTATQVNSGVVDPLISPLNSSNWE